MIDLYTWGTPNGRKVSIMLEECSLPYRVHAVDIAKGEQDAPAFRAINPNGKIPAIVDSDGPGGKAFTLVESGAILRYLSGKTGRFLPSETRRRFEAIQWLMFQMAGVGPMLGQAHHFLRAAKQQVPYAIERYTGEARRLYGVLDGHLATHEHLADEYSVADVATYPWVARHEWHRVDLGDFPHVRRWFEALGARRAVAQGMRVPFLN